MTDFITDALASVPVLAILRGMGVEQTIRIVEKAGALGVILLEVPLHSATSLDSLEAAIKAGTRYGMIVGVGTALTPDDVELGRQRGARFTVSPGFDPEVALASRRYGLPHLPGVSTPTEVHVARKAGLLVQKFFPASVLGPAWITAMRGPFPDVRFVATGGIGPDNAADFLAAGALGASFGSSITSLDRLPDLPSAGKPSGQ